MSEAVVVPNSPNETWTLPDRGVVGMACLIIAESIVMGYVKCRQDKLNRRRYTAVYRDVRGIERSAGTFTRKERAARAWKSAEAAVADGRYLDADQGRKRFADSTTEHARFSRFHIPQSSAANAPTKRNRC